MIDNKLHIAIIGMGQRGKATLARLADIPQAEVVVTCDKETDWHEVINRQDIHLIYICTPWDSHVEIAVEAMKQGRHVAIEVPAAMTVTDCELLVRIARWTGRHCVMLENCCYDTWHLGIREMVRKGLFGRITHLEGAYIHPVEDNWMSSLRKEHQGNPYPTHGLGPMCQLLPTDDRLESLVSISNVKDEQGNHLNDTLIRTRRGITMLLQYDTSTPRPYNRLQTVCGTKGFAQKYPLPTIRLMNSEPSTTNNVELEGEEATSFVESQISPTFRQLIEEGHRRDVKNVMNYMMDRRLIDSLLTEVNTGKTLHLDMDVHEAALWSCMTELTERSALQEGKRVLIPDF